jgi:hypothetical protein
MTETRDKHWYYPSAIIGCGLTIDELLSEELTCLRSKVTCPACIAQLQADKAICEACKLGAPEAVVVDRAPPHVCDPALA